MRRQSLRRPCSRSLANDATKTDPSAVERDDSPDPQEPTIVTHIAVRAEAGRIRISTGLAHYLEHMLFRARRSSARSTTRKRSRISKDRVALRRAAEAGSIARVLKEIDSETQASAAFAVLNSSTSCTRGWASAASMHSRTTIHRLRVEIPKNRIAQWARVESQRQRRRVPAFWPEPRLSTRRRTRAR
jgi:hypothetical protein